MPDPRAPASEHRPTTGPGSLLGDLFTARPAPSHQAPVKADHRARWWNDRANRRLLATAGGLIACALVLGPLVVPRLLADTHGRSSQEQRNRAVPTTRDSLRAPQRRGSNATRPSPSLAGRSASRPRRRNGSEARREQRRSTSRARSASPLAPPTAGPPPEVVPPVPQPGPPRPVPPARRAPAFPASVPPGSPPEFL